MRSEYQYISEVVDYRFAGLREPGVSTQAAIVALMARLPWAGTVDVAPNDIAAAVAAVNVARTGIAVEVVPDAPVELTAVAAVLIQAEADIGDSAEMD